MVNDIAKGHRNALTATVQSKRVYSFIYIHIVMCVYLVPVIYYRPLDYTSYAPRCTRDRSIQLAIMTFKKKIESADVFVLKCLQYRIPGI